MRKRIATAVLLGPMVVLHIFVRYTLRLNLLVWLSVAVGCALRIRNLKL